MPFLEYWDGEKWVSLQPQASGGAIRLRGFVDSTTAIDGVLQTVRGPDALLSRIPAGGDVSLGGHRITDLDAPQSMADAVNMGFLWALLNDEIV